jgi:hypothetical protein
VKNRLVTAAVVLGGLTFAVPGVWAFGWPESFYDNVATYPPYNLHLFHDVGAFQLGVAAALFGALIWRDALVVALFGGTVGMVVHTISHFLDSDLGGRPSDPWLLAAVSLVVTAAFVLRLRAMTDVSRPTSRRTSASKATGGSPLR